MARRDTDPFASFNFSLEIDGITKAGFSEVTGLNAEVNIIEYRDGKDGNTPRKLPGLFKQGNITLKRGVIQDAEMFKWFKTGMDGDIDRKQSISIVLLDEKRTEKVRWNLSQAWPSKYIGADMKANANEIAIESLEICHEGMERA
jgi:phage tail-like protein